MDKSNIIEQYLNLLGSNCLVVDKNGDEHNSKCVVTQLWKRNKILFEPKHSRIGFTGENYYSVLFPKSFDTTNFTERDTLVTNGKRFYFVKSEPIFVSGRVQYYFATVREIYEEDEDVFG